MNAITCRGESHDFATVADLLALPSVAKFLDDPQFDYWLYDGFTIYAVDKHPIKHLVGIVKERVVLPPTLKGGRPVNHE